MLFWPKSYFGGLPKRWSPISQEFMPRIAHIFKGTSTKLAPGREATDAETCRGRWRSILSGGDWNMTTLFFQKYWEWNNHPNWLSLTLIFFRGVFPQPPAFNGTTNPYPDAPWWWNIYLQNWVIYGVNVGIHIPAPWSIWVTLPWNQQTVPSCWKSTFAKMICCDNVFIFTRSMSFW